MLTHEFSALLTKVQKETGIKSAFITDILFNKELSNDERQDQLFEHWTVDLYMLSYVTGLNVKDIARAMQLMLGDLTHS